MTYCIYNRKGDRVLMAKRRLGFRRKLRLCEVRVEIKNGRAELPRIWMFLTYEERLWAYDRGREEEITCGTALSNLHDGPSKRSLERAIDAAVDAMMEFNERVKFLGSSEIPDDRLFTRMLALPDPRISLYRPRKSPK